MKMRTLLGLMLLTLALCSTSALAAEDGKVAGRWPASLQPITIHKDGTFEISKKMPPEPFKLDSWIKNSLIGFFAPDATAAGFDATYPLASAVGAAGRCNNTGTYVGMTNVPYCDNSTDDTGVFYIPFALSTTPASPPSFTVAFQAQAPTSGADTTSGHNWCYRASAAVVTTSTIAADYTALAYTATGAPTALVVNSNANCAANSKVCTGTATASFIAKDNGTSADCATTACNNNLVFFKIETRNTGCTATIVSTKLAYGIARITEAN